MIDLRRLRDDPAYRAGVEKDVEAEQIDAVLDADERRRSAMHKAEEAQAAQNAASKEIGRAEPSERESKIAEASRLKSELEALEALEDSATKNSKSSLFKFPTQHMKQCRWVEKMTSALKKKSASRTSPPPHDHAELGEL